MNTDLASIDLLEHAAIAEEVASVLRHDLRGKMGVVLNSVYYLRKKLTGTSVLECDPRMSTLMGLMEDEVGAVEKLLTERVGFRKFFARTVVSQPVDEAIDLAVARLRSRVTPPIEVSCATNLPLHSFDKLEVALALDCLLVNAAEAAPGEPIRVEARAERSDTVVTISDRGPGIAADKRESAFVPLTSTKEGHLGVGLNIARRIATRYGGELGFDSPEGTGLRVRVVLRRTEA